MSKIYDTIFESNINYVTFDLNLNNTNFKDLDSIMFRFISIDNRFMFAEEIVTGAIFPCLAVSTSGAYGYVRDVSHLVFGKYYIKTYCLLPYRGNFNIDFLEEEYKKEYGAPSEAQIKAYIEKHKDDKDFIERIKNYEKSNTYMCDLDTIKKRISDLRKSSLSSNTEDNIDLSDIESFGFNLSTQEDLCHAVGRDSEIEEIIKSIVIKGKSILLVGDSGVGKTAIVEELAREIKENTNPWLKDKIIISINANSLVSGTRYRGDFEENMQKLIAFAKRYKHRVILFIDEVHALYGLGTNLDNRNEDAMNILKPYISNRDITIIGATTTEEYSRYLVPDSAFCGRFDKINISKLSIELQLDILVEYLNTLSEKYGISYSIDNLDELLLRVIDLTNIKHQVSLDESRVSNIRLAKSIIEDAFATAIYHKKEKVEAVDILLSISKCNRLSSVAREKASLELKRIELGNTPSSGPSKVIPFRRTLKNSNE